MPGIRNEQAKQDSCPRRTNILMGTSTASIQKLVRWLQTVQNAMKKNNESSHRSGMCWAKEWGDILEMDIMEGTLGWEH